MHIGEDSSDTRRLLARTAQFAQGHGVQVDEQIIVNGPPAPTINAIAVSSGSDAIILGDSSRTLLARRILGDVALEMVRDCPLPLFLSH